MILSNIQHLLHVTSVSESSYNIERTYIHFFSIKYFERDYNCISFKSEY